MAAFLEIMFVGILVTAGQNAKLWSSKTYPNAPLSSLSLNAKSNV
jgi:hypothetical protein